MKVGIMQPYFFPYIGYWQLINAVDKFVIYDDVSFINRGWINRNRILYRDQVRYLNVYLKKASQNKRINEIEVSDRRENVKSLSLLQDAYKKAPYFEAVYPVIEKIIVQKEKNLAMYNGFLIQSVCEYLGITTPLMYSSKIEKDNNLRGQYKILAICKALGATEYCNAIGGKALYDRGFFSQNGVEIHFLHTKDILYRQFGTEFYENLSIIDVMMFNDVSCIRKMFGKYEWV